MLQKINNKRKLLLLAKGYVDRTSIPIQERLNYLSERFYGNYIFIDYKRDDDEITSIGNFKLHSHLYHPQPALLKHVRFLCRSLFVGLYLSIKNRDYDVIISPNPLTTGVIAILIGKVTSTKVVIEVNGNFDSAFTKNSNEFRFFDYIKHKFSEILIPFTLKYADRVKLVYRNQLLPLNLKNIDNIKTSSFVNFVPISHFATSEKKDNKYILLLGYPWFLKGVDILINAFNKISPKYPEYRLKVVGWCPEGKKVFEAMKEGNDKIELCDSVYYDGVIKYMTECSLYVLASRTDSSPRVLREAMASKKPIIASNIDGVPDLIIDKYNGLLFEKENIDDLAEKIDMILSDKDLASTLAENGLKHVQSEFSEDRYVNNYFKMVNDLLIDTNSR